MKKNIIVPFAAICCALMFSCSESILNEPTDSPNNNSVTKSSQGTSSTQSPTLMVLGEKLNNPYALDVMQAAAESLTPVGKPVPTLTATDLYVRFLPKDSAELAVLYDVEKLELFDYPLDYEILVDGSYFHDPSIPEGNPTWLYTTVTPDYDFPDVKYEILETCYIPQEISVKSSSSVIFSPEDLEREAYRLAGLDSMWIDEPLTRAAEYPSGRFTVYDTETREYVPVKGAKIRVHNIIKWATAYTDQDGYYTIGKKYRTNVHYAMIFQNLKGFKIWGNWAMFAPANHNMRFKSNSGYSDDFDTNSNAWDWATINNAAYDYYNFCSQEGISLPPQNLTIWCYRDFVKSGMAWMIPRIEHLSLHISIYDLLQLHVGLSLGPLRYLLPDIFVFPGNQRSSYTLYETTLHELSHASHFSVVGTDYWNKYINYIANSYLNYKSPYASENIEHSGICAVGEMWGYAMGYIYQYEKYKDGVSKEDSYPGYDYYFHPDILWDIYRDSYLDKGEIYRCLTKDVTDVPKLRNKMTALYPDKAVDLEFIFARYGEYDGMGYWRFKNATNTPKYIHVSGNCRTNFSETYISNRLDVDKNPNLINFGYLVMPDETVIIDSLAYNGRRQYDFYDILNVEEIAPSSIFIADENGLILESATLDGSIKLFTKCGSWTEVAGSKSRTWTFSYTGEKNLPIIKQ